MMKGIFKKGYEYDNEVLDVFIDTFAKDPNLMWGIKLNQLIDKLNESELSKFPKILRLVPSKDGILVKTDPKYFPYLYRGTLGPDYQYYREELLPTPDIVGKYIERGYITDGPRGYGRLYASRDPVVPFGRDEWGRFSSPRGSILFIDKSAVERIELEYEYDRPREGIEEVIFRGKVPLKEIEGLYVHEEDAKEILKRYEDTNAFKRPLRDLLYTHTYSDQYEFTKYGLYDVINITVTDKKVLSEPKYKHPKIGEKLREINDESLEFIKEINRLTKSEEYHCFVEVNTIEDYEYYLEIKSDLPLPIKIYSRIMMLPLDAIGSLVEYLHKKGKISTHNKFLKNFPSIYNRYLEKIISPYTQKEATNKVDKILNQFTSLKQKIQIMNGSSTKFDEVISIFNRILDSLEEGKNKLKLSYYLDKVVSDIPFGCDYLIDSILIKYNKSLIDSLSTYEIYS
jgi:hypothetical protein